MERGWPSLNEGSTEVSAGAYRPHGKDPLHSFRVRGGQLGSIAAVIRKSRHDGVFSDRVLNELGTHMFGMWEEASESPTKTRVETWRRSIIHIESSQKSNLRLCCRPLPNQLPKFEVLGGKVHIYKYIQGLFHGAKTEFLPLGPFAGNCGDSGPSKANDRLIS